MSEEHGQPASPPRKGIRRGIYILPSAFTIGNILCGFYAVINSLKGYQVLDASHAVVLLDNAARAIGFAVLLDGLDGRIARMTKATSEFGLELDSIADVLTFGIAPAVLAYTWGYGSTPGLERLGWGVSFFFLICGALRLARFNVVARAPRFSVTGTSPKLDKRSFVGLPIPAAAGLLAAIIHFSPQPLVRYPAEKFLLYSYLVLIAVALLAVLMVSTVKYRSFKNVGLSSNKPFVTLPLLSLLVAGIWFYSQEVLLVVASAYVLHGPALKVWSLLTRFRTPASEEDPSSQAPLEQKSR
jgi:CDP-diacylglycerol---serine O-phosphatidyltransferase